MRKSLALPVTALALLTAACGSSNSSSSTSKSGAATTTSSTASAAVTKAAGSVVLTTRDVPGIGVVLVNRQGRTLYTFAPDKANKVTCVGGCASAWPPLFLAAAATKPATSGQVKAALVSSDPDPAGGRVITYAGWPLYLYVADPTAGTAHGQAINSAGGLWFVISPSGKVITKKLSTAGATSTTSSY